MFKFICNRIKSKSFSKVCWDIFSNTVGELKPVLKRDNQKEKVSQCKFKQLPWK